MLWGRELVPKAQERDVVGAKPPLLVECVAEDDAEVLNKDSGQVAEMVGCKLGSR